MPEHPGSFQARWLHTAQQAAARIFDLAIWRYVVGDPGRSPSILRGCWSSSSQAHPDESMIVWEETASTALHAAFPHGFGGVWRTTQCGSRSLRRFLTRLPAPGKSLPPCRPCRRELRPRRAIRLLSSRPSRVESRFATHLSSVILPIRSPTRLAAGVFIRHARFKRARAAYVGIEQND